MGKKTETLQILKVQQASSRLIKLLESGKLKNPGQVFSLESLTKKRTPNKRKMKKDIVIGLGEIGVPILKLISKAVPTVGYDINPKLMDKKKI